MATNEAAPLLGGQSNAEDGEDGWKTSNRSEHERAREKTRSALDSTFCHYGIVFLVVLDLVCIFGEFLIQLFRCEHECMGHDGSGGGKKGEFDETSDAARIEAALGIVSLIFSSIFMVELMISVWAFGREFFRSTFRVFDGIVIVVGFAIDALSKGVIEEVGSVIIVLRLWRVFKVISELSTQAAEQVGSLNERISRLNEENRELKGTIEKLKKDSSDATGPYG